MNIDEIIDHVDVVIGAWEDFKAELPDFNTLVEKGEELIAELKRAQGGR